MVACSTVVHMAADDNEGPCPAPPSRTYLVRWVAATFVAVTAFILGYWLGWSRDSGWAFVLVPIILVAVIAAVCSAGMWGWARAEEIARECPKPG